MGLKRIQAISPKALMEPEPVPGVLKRSRVDPAHSFPSPRYACHEARAFENAQVFRDRGERQGEGSGKMADGRLPLRQTIKDGPAGRIGKRLENLIQFILNHVVEYIGPPAYTQPFG